jgi:dolichyl-phosphate beta-glucosyltransferase
MPSDPRYSVVIPAYNEAGRLPRTLEQISAFLQAGQWDHEILVVDDGSRDRTAEVVRAFAAGHPEVRLLKQPRNLGKGAAIQAGVGAARGELVLFTDADLSTPIEELARLEQALENGAAVAIASRAVAGSRIEEHQPFYREWMGKSFNLLVRLLLLPGIHGLEIRVVPVAWRISRHSKVAPVRDAWRMLGDLFRVLWRHRKG